MFTGRVNGKSFAQTESLGDEFAKVILSSGTPAVWVVGQFACEGRRICNLLERLFIGENRVADAELRAEVDSMLAVLVRVGIAEAAACIVLPPPIPALRGAGTHA